MTYLTQIPGKIKMLLYVHIRKAHVSKILK